MRTKLATALAAAVIAMMPGAASAHPHVFADATLQVTIDDDGNVAGLGHVWRFDDLFSSTVLLEFDANRDNLLGDDELREVADVVRGSLAEFNYFQLVTADGRDVEMVPPETMIANYEDQQLTIMFETEPAAPMPASGKLAFGIYDPTFYTALDFYEDDMLIVEGLPDRCTRTVVRPSGDEAIAQNQQSLTEDFFNDPTGNDLGAIFATRLELDCTGTAVAAVAEPAASRSGSGTSLGIGTGETSLPSTGLFSGLTNWVNGQQQGFYRSLTDAMKSMREDGTAFWLLISLSFAYGIFHAAGPGHGKAVISSYILANEVALRRGIMLSFISAFLQAATAIVLVGAVYLFLRGTTVSMGVATWYMEVASYALVTLFGAWLLWQKAGRRLRDRFRARPAHSLSAAVNPAVALHGHDHHHHHDHDHDHHGHHHAGHDHHHGPGEVCDTCGHSHAPDPAMLGGREFDWRSAWAAIAAVGMRPCSGALIVLSFALLNGLVGAGILSVLAMALGTAITVSALATLAVTAKTWAVMFAGGGRADTVHAAIEIAGAALVFMIGLLLLAASLA